MNLPNKLTVLRVLMIPLFLALFLLHDVIPANYLWALVVFSAASLTDLADGRIARSRGLVTDFGKLMDPLADKLLVMSAMICFITVEYVSPVVVVVILSREFLVTSIRLVAAAGGAVIAADGWGKVKTAMQMVWICCGLLMLAVDSLSSWLIPNWALTAYNVIVALVTVLTVVSGANYTWKNRGLFADM